MRPKPKGAYNITFNFTIMQCMWKKLQHGKGRHTGGAPTQALKEGMCGLAESFPEKIELALLGNLR